MFGFHIKIQTVGFFEKLGKSGTRAYLPTGQQLVELVVPVPFLKDRIPSGPQPLPGPIHSF